MFSATYQKEERIGKGGFGEAWKVTSKVKTGVFIMKEVSGLGKREIEMGKNEIRILKECHHENVVKYVDDFSENGKFLIVMEFCEGGDLETYIKQQRQLLPEDQIMNWFKQMISGIDYVHRKKILHRDLKPANIFLTSKFQAKIGDFGISKSLGQTLDMANTVCGTFSYMAPEVIKGVITASNYDNKADIWSLGCIVYELATLKLAFGGSYLFQNITQELF